MSKNKFLKVVGGVSLAVLGAGAVVCAVPESREWLLDKTAPYSNVYKEMEKENIFLKDEIEKVKEELGLKTEELENTKTLLLEKETLLATANLTIAENEETITSLNAEIETLQAQITENNERIAELETLLSNSESEKETLQAEIDSLTTRNTNLQNQMNRYLEQRDNALARNEELQSQIDALNAEIQTLQAEIATLNARIVELENELDNVTNKVNDITIEYTGKGYHFNYLANGCGYGYSTGAVVQGSGLDIRDIYEQTSNKTLINTNFTMGIKDLYSVVFSNGSTYSLEHNEIFYPFSSDVIVEYGYKLNGKVIESFPIDLILDNVSYFYSFELEIEQSETTEINYLKVVFCLGTDTNLYEIGNGIASVEIMNNGETSDMTGALHYSLNFNYTTKMLYVIRSTGLLPDFGELTIKIVLLNGETYIGTSDTENFQMELVTE